MTPRSIAALAFKVLALLAVLDAIGPGAKVLPTMVLRWPYDSGGGSSALMALSLIAPIALPLLFGAALWIGADKLADQVSTAPTTETSPSLEAMEQFAFSVLGVLIVALTIPNIATVFYYYWQLSLPGGVEVGSVVDRRAAVIGTAVQIALGVWLLFGSAGIANLLRRLRGR